MRLWDKATRLILASIALTFIIGNGIDMTHFGTPDLGITGVKESIRNYSVDYEVHIESYTDFDVRINVTNFGVEDVHDLLVVYHLRENDELRGSSIRILKTLEAKSTNTVNPCIVKSADFQHTATGNLTGHITIYQNFVMVYQATVLFKGQFPEPCRDDVEAIDFFTRFSLDPQPRWEMNQYCIVFYHWITVENKGPSDAHNLHVILQF